MVETKIVLGALEAFLDRPEQTAAPASSARVAPLGAKTKYSARWSGAWRLRRIKTRRSNFGE
jgi:hypothetical protein